MSARTGRSEYELPEVIASDTLRTSSSASTATAKPNDVLSTSTLPLGIPSTTSSVIGPFHGSTSGSLGGRNGTAAGPFFCAFLRTTSTSSVGSTRGTVP